MSRPVKQSTIRMREVIFDIVSRRGKATPKQIAEELAQRGIKRTSANVIYCLSHIPKQPNVYGYYTIENTKLVWKPLTGRENVDKINFKQSAETFRAAVESGLVTPCGIMIGTPMYNKCYHQQNCYNGFVCKIAVPGSGTRQAYFNGKARGD